MFAETHFFILIFDFEKPTQLNLVSAQTWTNKQETYLQRSYPGNLPDRRPLNADVYVKEEPFDHAGIPPPSPSHLSFQSSRQQTHKYDQERARRRVEMMRPVNPTNQLVRQTAIEQLGHQNLLMPGWFYSCLFEVCGSRKEPVQKSGDVRKDNFFQRVIISRVVTGQ